MTSSNIIEALELAVGFDKVPVLERVSVQLVPNQIVAVAGPNGAGKSTFVKTMARQLKPIAGSVQLNGKNIWEVSTREFAG